MKHELSKERLEELANFRGAPVTHSEEVAMARALLAAHEQEPVATMHRLVNKRNGQQHPWVYTAGAIKESEGDIFKVEVHPLYTHPAPAPAAAPEEIVGWVREENGDGRDPLFLCGSVKPDMGKTYNSQYFPVKRAAMLNGGK